VNRRKFIKSGLIFVPTAMAQPLAVAQMRFWEAAAKKKATVASGPTFLVNENFEGTGTPSGWFIGGSGNPDSTSPAVSGAQSLKLSAATSDYGQLASEASGDELYFKCKVQFSTLPSSTVLLLQFIDSGFSQIGGLYIDSTGHLSIDLATFTTSGMSADTTYYLWVHIKKGTGSNAVLQCAFAETDSRPAWLGYSTGANTADVYRVKPNAVSGAGMVFSIDDVQVAAEDF